MPTQINRDQVRERLEEFDLQPLFIEDLGWIMVERTWR